MQTTIGNDIMKNVESNYTINTRTKTSAHPQVADFADTLIDELAERSEPLTNQANACYRIAGFNATEMATIALSNWIVKNGTTAELKRIITSLWVVLSGLDISLGLCPNSKAWRPPTNTLAVLSKIGKTLAS